MRCCYCLEPLIEGEYVVQAQRVSYQPMDDPPTRIAAVAVPDWGHLGCWRLSLRQAEDDAVRRRDAKRARFAAPEG